MSGRYSETLTELYFEPKNRGSLKSPSGVGVSGVPGAGPFIVFQIACSDGIVRDARFECHNCGVTVASGSKLTELIIDQKLENCLAIDPQMLSDALDGVPADKAYAVTFVLLAMQQAVREVLQ